MSSESVREMDLEFGSVATAVIIETPQGNCITCTRITALLAAGALAGSLAGWSLQFHQPGCKRVRQQQRDPKLTGAVTVCAAASLKATFTKIACDFEAANPGTKVTLNFAGSSDLVTQITQGAPADVFVRRRQEHDQALQRETYRRDGGKLRHQRLGDRCPIVRPAWIASFADLRKPGVKVVVCAPQVPRGSAAETIGKAIGGYPLSGVSRSCIPSEARASSAGTPSSPESKSTSPPPPLPSSRRPSSR